MPSIELLLAAAALMGLSGLPTCLAPPRSRAGQLVSAIVMAAGGALGFVGLAAAMNQGLVAGAELSLSYDWSLPWGSFSVGLDPLSAFFLALVFLVPPLGSVYGLGYWSQRARPRSGRRLGLAYGVLAGAMVLVVLARDGCLFLIAWELMALAAYFAATAADDGPALRRAGWIYLIATHVGTLCLFAMFALWRNATGSFALSAGVAPAAAACGPIFVLALVGFGFKAGLVPLHFWLPEAHANAPSHVSAVMSGVMLKMGIYGIARMSCLLGSPPAWWGATLVAAGALTGLAGIVFAIGQGDIKRALAYSSVENLGIIAMGLGLGLLGLSLGRPELFALGTGGALLHCWNHGLFKSLLFLCAGGVLHETGTRDIEKLGGLAKKTPKLATLFLVGAVAICALPPLNGFAGELLIYLGFFRGLSAGARAADVAALGAVALAMIGALAVACFVRLYSTTFLGSPRGESGERAKDPPASMLLPMALLAALCAAIGLFPGLVLPALQAVLGSWGTGAELPALAEAAPFGAVSLVGLALVAGVTLSFVTLKAARSRALRRAGGRQQPRPTWDCGYAAPAASMQYTGSSFGATIVGLFAGFLRPRSAKRAQVRGYFPQALSHEESLPDAVLDRAILPAARALDARLPGLRFLQRGQIHLYLLYILLATILLIAFGGLGVAP